MSAPRPTPSRLVLALLRLASSADAANAAVGDLLEALDERAAAGRAPRWPRLWLDIETLKCAIAAAKVSVPRGARACGHGLRDAARALRGRPAHAFVILLILGAGIAAATVTFTVVDAVLFRPLLLDPDERLVSVRIMTSKRGRTPSAEEARAMRDRASLVQGSATFRVGRASATIDGVTEAVNVAAVMPDFFGLAGLRPDLGRLWTDDDVASDGGVAVVSHDLWQRRLNADPGVLGRTIDFEDGPRRVIGVLTLDADLAFEEIGWKTQVFLPPSDRLEFFAVFGTGALARLRPGASMEAARAELTSVLAPFASAAAPPDPAWGVEVSGFRSAYVRVQDVRSWMLMVLGAVGLVVLIACVNAANLMLTRSAGRAHELAVRASLGASRTMIAGTLIAESLSLSTAAGVCALVLSAGSLGAVKSMLPFNIPRAAAISLDGRVLAAAVLAAIVTGVLFGAIPAWEASRAAPVGLLKDGGTAATTKRRTWRAVFLVAQVSCVAALLVLSTLFVGSFIRVATTDLGFDRSRLIAAATVTDYTGTVHDVRVRLARIPGVTGVAAVGYSSLPLVGPAFGGAYGDETLGAAGATACAASTKAVVYRVTPDYFDVAGIPFRRGSTWSSSASPDSRPIVIDESVARQLCGDRSPLGTPLTVTNHSGAFTVVGVVPDAYTRGPEAGARASAYTAMSLTARPSWVGFFLRTAGPPQPLVRTVEAELAAVSKPNNSAGSGVRVVDDAYRRLTASRRFTGTLMGLFAVIQVIIGAAGIYAVTSSVVAQQTREFGVRIALGATSSDIHRRVLVQAGRHVLAGLAIGLPAAWWMSRGFSALFFKVQPGDASVYLIVSGLIVVVAFVAAVIPARRAARVDPIVSLRTS